MKDVLPAWLQAFHVKSVKSTALSGAKT